MTQYVSGSETVRHESLLDQIKVRSAFQTPLLSRLPHETCDHVTPEWVLDEPFTSSDAVRNLATPHADSRQEGSDFTYETPNYEVRVKTVNEIKHHGVEMSGTDRSARVAGMNSTWDYRVGKTTTKHFNSIDNTLMYGTGSPAVDGSGAHSDEFRRTQGLIQSAAWTGLERMHATAGKTQIQDVYGTNIPSSMWSVFKNLDHSNITLESFYNDLVSPLLTAGGDMETSRWAFQCGYRVMQRVARFLIADGGTMLNERNRNADETMGSDYLNTFRLASGDYVTFRTNRWLNETDDTFTVDNTKYPAGSPTYSPDNEGSQTTTFYGDQTIIGYEPGCARVLFYREPGFKNVETAGDYSRMAIVSEFALQVDHPLSVAGLGNVLG
jgi:hypothetical protein